MFDLEKLKALDPLRWVRAFIELATFEDLKNSILFWTIVALIAFYIYMNGTRRRRRR